MRHHRAQDRQTDFYSEKYNRKTYQKVKCYKSTLTHTLLLAVTCDRPITARRTAIYIYLVTCTPEPILLLLLLLPPPPPPPPPNVSNIRQFRGSRQRRSWMRRRSTGNYAGEIVHSSTLDTMPRMPALWSSSSDANGCGKSGTTRAGDGSDAEKQKGREFDKLPASRPTVLPTGNR